MGPLFTTYDLRLEDAHIPTHEIDKKLSAAGLDGNEPYVIKGRMLIHNVGLALLRMAAVLKNVGIKDPQKQYEVKHKYQKNLN